MDDKPAPPEMVVPKKPDLRRKISIPIPGWHPK
jgi:hypothetical protein